MLTLTGDLNDHYEIDDYPGTGSNPKHKPPPPSWCSFSYFFNVLIKFYC